MGTVARKEEKPKSKKRMFGFLLLSLPGLLTAAPASLTTKHVVKAPSPIYTPPVYNEHTGQGINHGYGGQGLALDMATELPMARVMPMVPMQPLSNPAMCSLDIQLILRVITLAIMLAIRWATMSAIRLATMLATRLDTMLATRLVSTLEATSTTLLEGSIISSLPTLLPSTSTLATLVLDSRLQTPLTEQIIVSDNIIFGNRHLLEKQ